LLVERRARIDPCVNDERVVLGDVTVKGECREPTKVLIGQLVDRDAMSITELDLSIRDASTVRARSSPPHQDFLVVVAPNGEGARVARASDGEPRVGAACDQVTHKNQCIDPLRVAGLVEQVAELVTAAVDISYKDRSTHRKLREATIRTSLRARVQRRDGDEIILILAA
jgi:hypothetical protein